ncbi:MAG: O-antigen ligase family protein [Clostridia bacterium]|nr:O-antigen ligase family protein [Clostridia bacterium]
MTGVVQLYKKTKIGLEKYAPAALFALLIIQPLLDIISYWANEWSFTVLTTLVRFAMFGLVMVYCYIISDRKKVYIIASAVMLAYWILHMIACFRAEGGYVSIFGDITNFFRTVHLPYFTFAFITVFRKSDKVPEYVQKAFCINMVIMMHALVISYMTGTQIYTYSDKGLMSWASVHNSQSAILAFIVPLMLLYAYNKKNKIMYYIVAMGCLINLFFVGTKVDYFSIFIIALGMMILLIIAGEKNLFYYAVLFLAALLCALCYNQSIAFDVKITHQTAMDIKQEYVEDIVEPDPGEAPLPEHLSWEMFYSLTPKEQYGVREIYEIYLGGMVQKYGFERVFEKYNFSLNVKELTAARPMKVNFAEMAFEDANTMTKLFGYEYKTLIYDYTRVNSEGRTVTTQQIYDLENDFPSVFYFSGYVGFAIYIAFLLYFVLLILVAVITRFKKCVNVENGLLAITFALALGTSQFSGNVLRRPNASIYFSVILAYIYYVTVIKENVRFRDIFGIFKKKEKKA